jgi:hypothetical protein
MNLFVGRKKVRFETIPILAGERSPPRHPG